MTGEVLGAGRNYASIYDRLGRTKLLDLPDTTTIKWGRALSAITTAELSIAAKDCTTKLDRFHPLAHTLVVERDPGTGAPPRRVWEGPIRRRFDTRSGLNVVASDVLGWTERRQVKQARKLASAAATTELAWSVTQAFNQDDPNVLAFVQMVGVATGGNVSRDIAPRSTYHAEDINSLAGAGAAYTVLGRSILYFADVTLLGRTPTLAPENHLQAEVEIVEDGDLLATEVTATDDNSGRATVGGTDSYYGLVSSIVSVGGTKRRAGLAARAQALLNQSNPQPITITVPAGAQLRPDAPFPIELLVPGTLVPLQTTTATGRTLRKDFVLTSVEVSQSARSDEQVSITLGPLTVGSQVVAP